MIKDLWYKNAVVYCLHVGTFMDTNGDGVGDFEGLMRRLDYLAGLGITCIWLMPFQASPRRDDGYDIADYYTVDPCYGTLGDFVELTHAAKQRGIRVIIDLVVNHTSEQHPWFQESRKDKTSRYRDYYVWSNKKPKDDNQGMVFPGVRALHRGPQPGRRARSSPRRPGGLRLPLVPGRRSRLHPRAHRGLIQGGQGIIAVLMAKSSR